MNRDRSPLWVLLLLLPVGLAVSACPSGGRGGGNSGGGGNAPTTANLQLSFKDGWTADPTCGTRQVLWKFEPLQLTGSEGRATAFEVNKTYTEARREPEQHPSTGTPGFRCYFDDGLAAAGLRIGRWRISMDPAASGPTCEETVGAGAVPIHFAEGQPGCVKGSGYPGR